MSEYYDTLEDYDDLDDELIPTNSLPPRRSTATTTPPPSKRGRGASGAITRGRGRGSPQGARAIEQAPPSPVTPTKRSTTWTPAEYQVIHKVYVLY